MGGGGAGKEKDSNIYVRYPKVDALKILRAEILLYYLNRHFVCCKMFIANFAKMLYKDLNPY